jgi:hypothetical protein
MLLHGHPPTRYRLFPISYCTHPDRSQTPCTPQQLPQQQASAHPARQHHRPGRHRPAGRPPPRPQPASAPTPASHHPRSIWGFGRGRGSVPPRRANLQRGASWPSSERRSHDHADRGSITPPPLRTSAARAQRASPDYTEHGSSPQQRGERVSQGRRIALHPAPRSGSNQLALTGNRDMFRSYRRSRNGVLVTACHIREQARRWAYSRVCLSQPSSAGIRFAAA